MPVRYLQAWLIAGLLLTALPVFSSLGQAQEPWSNLKQADTDYRSGVAALSRNDLSAAQADFEKVVPLRQIFAFASALSTSITLQSTLNMPILSPMYRKTSRCTH
jgi:hypothetical protein